MPSDALGIRARKVRGIVYDIKAQTKPRKTSQNPVDPESQLPGKTHHLVRIARQRRYAASKTIRNLRNLGRPAASRTVRICPRKADCVHEGLAESHYSHNGTERWIKKITRTISGHLLAVWLMFSALMVMMNNHHC